MRLIIRCPSGLRLEFEGDLEEFTAFDGFLGELAQLERGLEELRITDLRGEHAATEEEPAFRSPTQHVVMTAVRELGVCTVDAICELTGLDAKRVTHALARLREKALVAHNGQRGALSQWAPAGTVMNDAEPAADPVEPSKAQLVHYGRPPTVQDIIVATLHDRGPLTVVQIMEITGLKRRSVENALTRMRHAGLVAKAGQARWQEADTTGDTQAAADDPPADPDPDGAAIAKHDDQAEDTTDEDAGQPSGRDTAERDPAPADTTPVAAGNGADTPAAPLRPVLEEAPGGSTPPGGAETRAPAPPRAPVSPTEERILQVVAHHGPCAADWVADQIVKNRRETGAIMREMARSGLLHDTGDGCFDVASGEEAQAA